MEDTINAINEKLNALDRTKEDTVSAYYCASQDFWGTDKSIIPYDKLLTSEVFEVPGGRLDIATGEFTATFSGVWEVTWSMRTQHKARDTPTPSTSTGIGCLNFDITLKRITGHFFI